VSILQTAADAGRTALRQGAVGEWASDGDVRRTRTLFNQSPQTVQISTITVSGPTNSHTYAVTITTPSGTFPITYTSDGSATTQEVVDGLVAAINADARIRGEVRPASTSSTVATLTGISPGRPFTLTESEGDLAVATTQAATGADAIAPGRAVITQGFDSAGEAEELGALAKSSLLTAQVQTISVAYVASNVLRATVWEVRGGEEERIAEREVTAATDQATTLTALAAALTASAPANSYTVTSSGTALVFTAAVAGFEFRAGVVRVSGGASEPAISVQNTTGPNPSTSIHQALRGVAKRPLDEECATIGGSDPTWPANHGLVAAVQGPLFVDSPTGVTNGAAAYVELGVTDDNGKFFMTGSATRVKLARAQAAWMREGNVASDAVAVLRLNFA
jgi:hypothetical protein